MTCLDLNLWMCGGLAATTFLAIFFFFKWCAVQGRLNNLLGDMGVEF